MTADLSCRVAWADDAPAIARVQVLAWQDSYAGLLPTEVLEGLDPEAMAAQWHQSLTSPPDARNRVLVALDANRVAGYVLTGPAGDPDCDPISVGEITDLSVTPRDRRLGHGSRLMQAAVDTLVADRFTWAVTWLAASDDDQRAFWTEAGWAPDGAHRALDLTGDGSTIVKQVRLHTALS